MSSPEAALWRAVIAQSIADATGIVRGKKPSAYKSAVRIRDEARNWLLNGSKDFKEVCHFALLDPNAVRESAERMRDGGWESAKPLKIAETLAA